MVPLASDAPESAARMRAVSDVLGACVSWRTSAAPRLLASSGRPVRRDWRQSRRRAAPPLKPAFHRTRLRRGARGNRPARRGTPRAGASAPTPLLWEKDPAYWDETAPILFPSSDGRGTARGWRAKTLSPRPARLRPRHEFRGRGPDARAGALRTDAAARRASRSIPSRSASASTIRLSEREPHNKSHASKIAARGQCPTPAGCIRDFAGPSPGRLGRLFDLVFGAGRSVRPGDFAAGAVSEEPCAAIPLEGQKLALDARAFRRRGAVLP